MSAIIILAAGKGTRMNSKYQKILHTVGGKPMVQHLFEAAEATAATRPVLVVGAGETGVQALLGERGQYAVQADRLGTGHATMMAEPLVKGAAEQVIVTYADMPLLQPETMRDLVAKQQASGAAVVLLSVLGERGSSFGRIVRGADGSVREICEVAEARKRANGDEILAIRELNAGVYCFSADFLWSNIHDLPLRQARSGQEYYLTDLIEVAVAQKLKVEAVITDDADECLGAGTRAEMVAVERAFRQRAIRKAQAAGVTLISPEQTFIDAGVTIGRDCVIWPNSYLQGDTTIGEDCVIGPNTIVRSAAVGNHCVIEQAVVEQVVVPDGTILPPFTHLSPEADPL